MEGQIISAALWSQRFFTVDLGTLIWIRAVATWRLKELKEEKEVFYMDNNVRIC